MGTTTGDLEGGIDNVCHESARTNGVTAKLLFFLNKHNKYFFVNKINMKYDDYERGK